ncbi:hypothetical protein AB1Y20_007402 [Prymnesium parvum]|uniref:Uncharacterized protein n=1 Tax=Prymnesium parvum TaxID=97485 RepID=A0AB34IX21_PRYPA|mmetsp:Transcript_30046/g.75068  ORF Transcript_30046/g.75068 Transcript_30046/m.75068 type:complete len:432 (+) Transcript_30046:1116-2411(+)
MATHAALAHKLIHSAGHRRALGRVSSSARLLQRQALPAGGARAAKGVPTSTKRVHTPAKREHTPEAPLSHVGHPGGATPDPLPKRQRATAPAPPAARSTAGASPASPAVAARSMDAASPENESKRQRAAAPAPPAAAEPRTDGASPENKARDYFAILMGRTTAPVPAAELERAQLEEYKRLLSYCLWVFSAEEHANYDQFHNELMNATANFNVTLDRKTPNWPRKEAIHVCVGELCKMYDKSVGARAQKLARELISSVASSTAVNILAKVGAARVVYEVLEYLTIVWTLVTKNRIVVEDPNVFIVMWVAFELAVQAARLSPANYAPPLKAIFQRISASPMNALHYVYDKLKGPIDLTNWSVLLRMLKAFEGFTNEHKSAIPRALEMMKDILATAPNIPKEWPRATAEDSSTVVARKTRVRDVLLVGLRQAP